MEWLCAEYPPWVAGRNRRGLHDDERRSDDKPTVTASTPDPYANPMVSLPLVSSNGRVWPEWQGCGRASDARDGSNDYRTERTPMVMRGIVLS